MSDWQPIETAPTDETRVLVCGNDYIDVAYVAWEEDGKPVWFNGDVTVTAEFWMPLPDVPRTTTQSPSPAKPLSFHPSHTCPECGHQSIPKPVERLDPIQSPPTKAEDR